MKSRTLCETFRWLAFATWELLRQARSVDHQVLEETITDLLCLELKSRNPSEVFTKNFNRSQEGRTGADWEWWFTSLPGMSSWLGIRVQAKVVNFQSRSFPHLHYKNRQGEYQSNVLTADARANSCIPLYCLYSHLPDVSNTPLSCGSFGPAVESFGCALLPMTDVFRLRAEQEQCDDQVVISLAAPWHCLVCCEGYAQGELPKRVWAYLEARGFVGAMGMDDWEVYGPRSEPPSYVRALIEGELDEAPDERVQAVTVFAERLDAEPVVPAEPTAAFPS